MVRRVDRHYEADGTFGVGDTIGLSAHKSISTGTAPRIPKAAMGSSLKLTPDGQAAEVLV